MKDIDKLIARAFPDAKGIPLHALKGLRAQAFTLVELMIVLTLLSLVSGVVGVSAWRLWQEQRFYAGVEAVVDVLRTSQDVMLINNTDLRVHLDADNGVVHIGVDTDKRLSNTLSTLFRKSGKVEGIYSVGFEDASGANQEGHVLLNFLSGGSVMSEGNLLLWGKRSGDESLMRVIALTGAPQRIKASSRRMTFKTITEDENEALFPQEVLSEEALPAT